MGGFFGGGASVGNLVGATSSASGVAGLVPAPAAGDNEKVLMGDATFKLISAQTVPTELSKRTNSITFFGSYSHASFGVRATLTGYVIWAPIYIRASKFYTTYSTYITAAGAANSVGKIAIYSIKSTAEPDMLICQSGTFATDSTGLKQPTMSSTFVSTGWYFAGVSNNSATNVSHWANSFEGAKGFISGNASGSNTASFLDYSAKSYSDLWPSTWSGTDNYANNIQSFICELS